MTGLFPDSPNTVFNLLNDSEIPNPQITLAFARIKNCSLRWRRSHAGTDAGRTVLCYDAFCGFTALPATVDRPSWEDRLC